MRQCWQGKRYSMLLLTKTLSTKALTASIRNFVEPFCITRSSSAVSLHFIPVCNLNR